MRAEREERDIRGKLKLKSQKLKGPRQTRASLSSQSFSLFTSKFLLCYGRRLDVVEVRERLREIRVPFHLQTLLIGTTAARRTFTVAAVELVHDVHAGHNLAECRERAPGSAGAGPVETRVVAE